MDMLKHFILTFVGLCIFCIFPSYAQSPKKILSKNDIIKYLPETSDGKAESFWNHVVAENKEFLETVDKIFNKKGGAAKTARETIATALGQCEAYYANDATLLVNVDSAKYDVLGYTKLANKIHVYYLDYDDVNAFCTPSSNVYVYSGLLNSLPEDKKYTCFLGVLAHEFAHGLLHHALVGQYNIAKKEKQNRLIADIATGMAVFHDSYSKARGTESMIPDTGEYSSKVHSWAQKATLMYQFKYNREQEYQSDIIAFRFLDWIGIGGETYLDVLQTLNQPFEYTDESSHPSTYDRMELIKYMCSQKRVRYNQ